MQNPQISTIPSNPSNHRKSLPGQNSDHMDIAVRLSRWEQINSWALLSANGTFNIALSAMHSVIPQLLCFLHPGMQSTSSRILINIKLVIKPQMHLLIFNKQDQIYEYLANDCQRVGQSWLNLLLLPKNLWYLM